MKLWAQASALWFFVCYATPAGAADTDCTPASGVSTCVDASALWVPAGRARFFGVAPGRASELELFAFGAAFVYSNRPIVLVAPSPDPEGRE